MSTEDILLSSFRVFDRVSNNVRVIRTYRDKYMLTHDRLEEKMALIQNLALEQMEILDNHIKKLKDEQDKKEKNNSQ